MKRTATLLLGALLACSLICPALAAEPAADAAPTRTAALYPVEVKETTVEGKHRLEKVYYLTPLDDPANIPTEDFDREGWHYTLLDVTRQDNTETETKDYSETVTLDSKSKDMDAIMPLLAATMEVTTEDGFSGLLTLNTASIKAEAAGYGTSSRTVTATRTYPNLSDADTSLIPKTVEDGGRTLTLADIQWQEAGGFYHATASYTGTATSKYATGYIITAEYAGEVVRVVSGETVYSAVFSGTSLTPEEAPPEETEPAPTDTPAPEPTPAAEADKSVSGNGGSMKWLLLLPAGAAVAGLVYGGKILMKKFKAKKDWSEYTK